MTREEIGEQTPPQLVDNAPAVWAMLAAVGWNLNGSAYSVEELIRDRYAGLVESPEAEYNASGRISLRRAWDGADFVGLELSIEVTTIWADDLPADFPTGRSPWTADTTLCGSATAAEGDPQP